jgi:hypothetical protein
MRTGLFLFITTSEKKTGFLLIEVFRKLINPQNDGHLDLFLGGLFLYVRLSSKHIKRAISYLSGVVIISHNGQFQTL